MVLTLPSTVSCGHRPTEDGDRRAAAQPVAAMCPFVVVELQKAIERALQRSAAREVLPPKRNPPMLVQDRFLQALDEAVGPRVARLRARHANAQALAAGGEDALEFLARCPSGRGPSASPPADSWDNDLAVADRWAAPRVQEDDGPGVGEDLPAVRWFVGWRRAGRPRRAQDCCVQAGYGELGRVRRRVVVAKRSEPLQWEVRRPDCRSRSTKSVNVPPTSTPRIALNVRPSAHRL
jgi:hypothetical protein